MPRYCPKRAILAALQRRPDFAPLGGLRNLAVGQTNSLLRWLDRSGLALSFFRRLLTHRATARITHELRNALDQRLARNMERTRVLLDEFGRLNEAFSADGITLATLKGFALTPDFCDAPHLRHQVDFDFLVDPNDVEAAAETLRSCGYSTTRLSRTGESCFNTALTHVPSDRDDLYAVQRHRQVDLHTSVWEDNPWFTLQVPHDCLQQVVGDSLAGVRFNRLAPEDAFLFHVLHAFRHSFRSWIRVSWLLEISHFLEVYQDHPACWRRVIDRTGQALHVRRVFALILGLTHRLFQTPIPLQLRQWTTEASTDSMAAWLEHFAVDWSISDWPGNMTNVFLAPDFIPDRQLRAKYWTSRLLPRTRQLSIGAVQCSDASTLARLRWERSRYLGIRSISHLKNVLHLPLDHLRWKRSLRAVRRAHPLSRGEAPVGEIF